MYGDRYRPSYPPDAPRKITSLSRSQQVPVPSAQPLIQSLPKRVLSELEPGEIDENAEPMPKLREGMYKASEKHEEALKAVTTYLNAKKADIARTQGNPSAIPGLREPTTTNHGDRFLDKLSQYMNMNTTSGTETRPPRGKPNAKPIDNANGGACTNGAADSAVQHLAVKQEKITKQFLEGQKRIGALESEMAAMKESQKKFEKNIEDELRDIKRKLGVLFTEADVAHRTELHGRIKNEMHYRSHFDQIAILWTQVERLELMTVQPHVAQVGNEKSRLIAMANETTEKFSRLMNAVQSGPNKAAEDYLRQAQDDLRRHEDQRYQQGRDVKNVNRSLRDATTWAQDGLTRLKALDPKKYQSDESIAIAKKTRQLSRGFKHANSLPVGNTPSTLKALPSGLKYDDYDRGRPRSPPQGPKYDNRRLSCRNFSLRPGSKRGSDAMDTNRDHYGDNHRNKRR